MSVPIPILLIFFLDARLYLIGTASGGQGTARKYVSNSESGVVSISRKPSPSQNPGADRGRIFSDAASERQRVQSTQGRRECADLFLELLAKQRDLFSRPHGPHFTVEQVMTFHPQGGLRHSPSDQSRPTRIRRSESPASNSANLMLDEPPWIVRMQGNAVVMSQRLSFLRHAPGDRR